MCVCVCVCVCVCALHATWKDVLADIDISARGRRCDFWFQVFILATTMSIVCVAETHEFLNASAAFPVIPYEWRVSLIVHLPQARPTRSLQREGWKNVVARKDYFILLANMPHACGRQCFSLQGGRRFY